VTVATGRSHEATREDRDLHAPAADGRPFDLGYGVRIERLPFGDAELVMNACDPRGHFFISKRPHGQRDSYIYEPAEADWQQNPYGWGPEQRLNAAMHLSRLVKDDQAARCRRAEPAVRSYRSAPAHERPRVVGA
jgi:hypothetical protein